MYENIPGPIVHIENQSIMSESNRIRKRSTILTLPDEVIVHDSSYLSTPSRALFAISQCCNPKATQLMIAQYEWDTLDFGALAAETASKLTDDDLAKILTLIKAKDNLKTLKLTGCAGIVGSGLKPLSKSTVLQEMDLHFFDRHNVYKSEKYNMHKTWQFSFYLLVQSRSRAMVPTDSSCVTMSLVVL